jgi:hypothetical protein
MAGPFLFAYYFNFTLRSITSMPTFFGGDVVCLLGVGVIFWGVGA